MLLDIKKRLRSEVRARKKGIARTIHFTESQAVSLISRKRRDWVRMRELLNHLGKHPFKDGVVSYSTLLLIRDELLEKLLENILSVQDHKKLRVSNRLRR